MISNFESTKTTCKQDPQDDNYLLCTKVTRTTKINNGNKSEVVSESVQRVQKDKSYG